MLLTLIHREALGQILSVRFYISFALGCILLIPATYILAEDYGLLQREFGPLVKEGVYIPWSSGSDRYWVNREVPRLHVLASGLNQSLSLRSHNTVHEGAYFGESQFVHNLLGDMFSHLDFVFFINIVGSLLAFTFTYDAISGERQQGTLRLVMAHPVQRALLILAKFLGSYLAFVISLLPALLGVILVLYLHPNVGLKPSDWEVSFWLLLFALLNIAVFFMLGLFVSCLTREPKTTLVALMILWVLLVLVVPNYSPLVATKLHPIPAFHRVQEQVDSLTEGQMPPVLERWAYIRTHGGNPQAFSPEEQREFHAIWVYHRAKFYAKECTKIWEDFFNQMDIQAKVAQYLSLTSPSATFTYLATDLSHTGIESEHAFRFATIGFRRRLMAKLDSYIQKTGDLRKVFRLDNEMAPDFTLPRPTVSEVISTHVAQSVALVVHFFLCFCGAQVAFIRSSI